jgi:hypothetical protein
VLFTSIGKYMLCEFMATDRKKANVYVFVSITNDMLRNSNDKS